MALEAGTMAAMPDERLVVRDPARGTVVEVLAIDDATAVAAAVDRGRVAQVAWGARPVRERAKLLRRARRELVRDRGAILERLERETGKARVDVVGELLSVCIESGHLVRRAAGWLRPLRVGTRPLFGKRGRVVFKPRGVVGIISPWNAPLTLALGDVVPALLAGNAVVVKPSELAPLAVSRAVAAMNRVLPQDVLQVVIGAAATGTALVDHVDMVCVTGSPETGRRVMERASRRLTPVLLELGGKDPMIVLADADLDRAARAAAWGGCMMSGQVCMSVERVYVEQAVATAFLEKLVGQVSALRVGPNGRDAEIDYGPFTSPRQLAIVEEHLTDAVAKGARVLCGGRRCGPETGDFFEATVLSGATHAMRIMREESFGPVIPVMAVQSAEEALALANDCAYGLNASVWTRDVARGVALAERIESGNVCVNECVVSAGVPALPFGGTKQSGLGTRHGGAEGLRQFCVRQAMLIEPGKSRTDGAWFPYSARRARLMERLLPLMFGW